ncbi:hypothetical protein RJT34_23405 [Clitoria ternatea]|uniref:Uncharacterized protein n=1 Tax=Clitoria ternatea TaxID=43366 RepID=A0AAN9IGI7_CLITE
MVSELSFEESDDPDFEDDGEFYLVDDDLPEDEEDSSHGFSEFQQIQRQAKCMRQIQEDDSKINQSIVDCQDASESCAFDSSEDLFSEIKKEIKKATVDLEEIEQFQGLTTLSSDLNSFSFPSSDCDRFIDTLNLACHAVSGVSVSRWCPNRDPNVNPIEIQRQLLQIAESNTETDDVPGKLDGNGNREFVSKPIIRGAVKSGPRAASLGTVSDIVRKGYPNFVLASSIQVHATEDSSVNGGGLSQNGKFSYGYASSPGKRSSMEDFYETRINGVDGEIVSFFGVFDAHDGACAAKESGNRHSTLVWHLAALLKIIFDGTGYMRVWDLGGQERLRTSWSTYYRGTNAVIAVIDSSDRARISIMKDELFRLLGHEDLQHSVILVFANKQDIKDAMTPAEITDALSLHSIKDHDWHIQACCALSGEGLYDGLGWIAQRVTGKAPT